MPRYDHDFDDESEPTVPSKKRRRKQKELSFIDVYGRSLMFGAFWLVAGIALLFSYYAFASAGQVNRKWQLALPAFGCTCLWIGLGLTVFPLDKQTLARTGKYFSNPREKPSPDNRFADIGLPLVWKIWIPMTVVVFLAVTVITVTAR